MVVEIFTEYDKVVFELLGKQEFFFGGERLECKGISFVFVNDNYKQDWREWIAAAMSCGLIEGGYAR